jgi:hypothetical protein
LRLYFKFYTYFHTVVEKFVDNPSPRRFQIAKLAITKRLAAHCRRRFCSA